MAIDHQLAGKLAAVLTTLGFVPYVASILRNQSRPRKASWIVWSVIGAALALGYKASGANATLWISISYAFSPAVVVLALYAKNRKKEERWPTLDRLSLWTGLLLFVPWTFFELVTRFEMAPSWGWILPRVTLYGGILVDSCGALPTIAHSWKSPKDETFSAWTFWLVGNVLDLFAVETWSLDVAAYAVYLTIPTLLVWPVLLTHRIKTRNDKLTTTSEAE